MPKSSFLLELPQDLQDALRDKFVENGFGKYDEILIWFQQQLEAREISVHVSRSTIARAGKKHKEFMEKIRETVELSKSLAETTPDERNDIVNALATIVPVQILDKLVEENVSLAALTKIGNVLDRIVSASLKQKRYMKEFNLELERRKKAATQAILEKGQEQGWSDAQIDFIKQQILGITVDDSAG